MVIMHRCIKISMAMFLVILPFISFRWAGLREADGEQVQARLPGPEEETQCRSLFTITDFPGVKTPATDEVLQYPGGNDNNRKGLGGGVWGLRSQQSRWSEVGVVGPVQHLLRQRSSPSGPSTDDYRQLAAFLPTLLSFQDNDNNTEDNQENGRPTPILRGTSRISGSGVLPYVPCAIAPFQDPASVTACFRERLARNDSLWIFFLGDSKIRNLFYAFLHRSDNEYHYTVKLKVGHL